MRSPALKGGENVVNSYIIQPIDQISHGHEYYWPFQTSGAA